MKARAMEGSAVAITVLSKFCMNKAAATIRAISRSEPVKLCTDKVVTDGGFGGSHGRCGAPICHLSRVIWG